MGMVQDWARQDRKAALVVSALGGLLGGLCCLAPIVLVSLSITTVAVANQWGNLLYGEYRWWFRLAALGLMSLTLALYLRRRGVCTLDQARRQRNRVINLVLLSLLGFTAVYVFWVYVVLHEWGIAVGLPWRQWEETWALPASVLLMFGTAVAALFLPRWFSGTASSSATSAEPALPASHTASPDRPSR